jgi:hypothetical protein
MAIDYETVKKEGEKYSLPNITPEEFERHGNFSSIITILTRIRNSRQDIAKRVQKEEKMKREVKVQPDPKRLTVSKREGPECCTIEKEIKHHCTKFGFDCINHCWMRMPGAVFSVEGLTITVKSDIPGQSQVVTKPVEEKKKGVFDW